MRLRAPGGDRNCLSDPCGQFDLDRSFSHEDAILSGALRARRIACHPFVIGEVAMGSISNRDEVLEFLDGLPRVKVTEDAEVLQLVEKQKLFSAGLSYVDAHLLTAAMLTDEARVWTRDRRLNDASKRLKLAAVLTH